MKPSLKALGLLFVMVMINSENAAAGLPMSATIAEFEKIYGNKNVTKPHLLEEGSIGNCIEGHVPLGPCCQRLIDLYKENLISSYHGENNLLEYPECRMSGYFKSRQCSNSGADCKCVNAENGEELYKPAANDLCPGEEGEDYEWGGGIHKGRVNYVDKEPSAKGPAPIRQRTKKASCGLTAWTGYECDEITNNNYGCWKSYCWRSCDESSECYDYSKGSEWCWIAGYTKKCISDEQCLPHAGASCRPNSRPGLKYSWKKGAGLTRD